MKKLLGVVLGLAIALILVGFVRNWFSLSRTDEETTTTIHLTINRQRLQQDAAAARQKIDSLRDGAGEEADGGGEEGPLQP
jgi:hypothetical protein